MKRKLILVVDDDEDVRETMSALLGIEGYEVEEASNGKEALEIAIELLPDMIFLDMWMPIMSGMQFCEHRRGYPSLCAIPVVICSADKDMMRVSHTYAQGFLLKPIGMEEMTEAALRFAGPP